MLVAAEEIKPDTWSARNAFWTDESKITRSPRRKRDRRKEPLVLCGHGMALRIDGGTLIAREGRTHYPQEPQTHRFFPGSNDIPPRIIILDGSGSVSFDVLAWLAEQSVPLIRIGWRGDVVTVAGGTGFAADQTNVTWQLETRAHPKRRLEFCRAIIRQKLEASLVTLENVVLPSVARSAALKTHELALPQLVTAPDLTAVRGVEAVAAAAYFSAWRNIGLSIKATSRRPVPEHWRWFSARTSLANGGKAKNLRASDPFNAMLNYGYGVLQAQVQVRTLTQGFDPTLGIMHHSIRGTPAYVFDLMEPERAKVDAAILRFVSEHEFSAADFTLRSDGVVRLSPQLARRIVTLASV